MVHKSFNEISVRVLPEEQCLLTVLALTGQIN